MIKDEWIQNNVVFNVEKYFTQNTEDINQNSAFLVITKKQVINGWTGRKGEQPHTDTFEKIMQIIYDIDKSQYTSEQAFSNDIKNLSGKQTITARMMNECQNRLLWFEFPASICPEQFELLSLWCQKNNILNEIQRNAPYQFIGFQHKDKNICSMCNLETLLEYASTIIDNQTTHIDDKNIIGYTLTDMLNQKHR